MNELRTNSVRNMMGTEYAAPEGPTLTTATSQRTVADVTVGDDVPAVEFPLSLYRLVVAAGGNRDFNSIHHNRSYALATGAPDAYASTFFLMGSWERVARDYIGSAGTIRSI